LRCSPVSVAFIGISRAVASEARSASHLDRNARFHPERVGFDRKLVRRVVREPPLISYERERDLIQADVDLMKIIQ
jgi:hypothetical protein